MGLALTFNVISHNGNGSNNNNNNSKTTSMASPFKTQDNNQKSIPRHITPHKRPQQMIERLTHRPNAATSPCHEAVIQQSYSCCGLVLSAAPDLIPQRQICRLSLPPTFVAVSRWWRSVFSSGRPGFNFCRQFCINLKWFV